MSDQETTQELSEEEQLVAQLEAEDRASEEQESSEGESLSSSEPQEAISSEAEGQFTIPEKFVGKTVFDVARAYSEVEKHAGKLSSEKADAEKRAKELEEKLYSLEQQQRQISQQQPSQPAREERDPYEWLDQELDQDPKGAIKKLAQLQREEARRIAAEREIQQRASEAESYYYQQRKENPDFAELDSEMQLVARKFGHLIKPELLNSRETIEMAYALARSNNLSRYVNREIEAARQKGTLAKDEKRRAASISSGNSRKSDNVPFEKLSTKDMEKALGLDSDSED